ncbi:Mitochondrial inner membrane protease atp23 [Coelomomyces lativittatus]|nr:Mitochondrial inner membrane protease atp23 [Coelomomyces lativittatus]
MATTTSTNPKDSSSSLTQAFAKWREHLCQWTGLGLTPEEHEVWLKKNTSKLQQQEHERCEQWKSEWIQKSPIVKFLMEHLEVAGCKFSSKHFYCQPCDALRSGGFSPEYGVCTE